jgi:glycerophosphoryl diester phosphodiesterase
MGTTRNPLRRGTPDGIWNIAHRGARAFAPENTLCAFVKAATFGCPMFELDVHVSKDGTLIVLHDDQLTRTTDVETRYPGRKIYYVSDFTARQIRTLDAGSWYARQLDLAAHDRVPYLRSLTDAELRRHVSADDRIEYASGNVHVPTLEEALALAQEQKMMVNIDIKALPRMYPGITQAVVGLINDMRMADWVLISSFDHEQLRIVRQLSDRIATGVLTTDRLANPGDYLKLLDADAYHPGCYDFFDSMGFGSTTGKVDPISIRHVRSAKRGVNVWTCNDKNQMRQLIEAGVTGLISDFPNRVRDVLAP